MTNPLSATQSLTDADIQEIASLLKTLSEPNRLMILEQIINGYQCNCDLGETLSLAPNLVSHHLSILCDSGLVKSERYEHDARWIFYSINENKLKAIKDILNAFFNVERIQPCLSSCRTKRAD